MNAQVPTTIAASAPAIASQKTSVNANAVAGRGQLYLTFTLANETFAIDILRIREIIEYVQPSPVPMMPVTLRGVINVRGGVVPVVDLAVRFGWQPMAVGRRTSIVIVEILYNDEKHVIGLVVDRVNAVTEIRADQIELPPAFGVRVNTDFISGMARLDNRFVIMLNIERTLSMSELSSIVTAGNPFPQ